MADRSGVIMNMMPRIDGKSENSGANVGGIWHTAGVDQLLLARWLMRLRVDRTTSPLARKHDCWLTAFDGSCLNA